MIKATVKSSMPLNDKIKTKLETFIKSKAKDLQTIDYIVDKSIVGGIILKIGDVIYDGSLKRHIEIIKEKI